MAEFSRCLICYEPVGDVTLYHAKCSRRFFGQLIPPELPYAYSDLSRLAEEVVHSHVTVTGVQAKLSLHLQSQSRGPDRLTLVGLWGYYILKPPMPQYPVRPEIEDLTMHLAEIAGIKTVPHALIRLQSGEPAYITRRIDRLTDGGRLHMEDMCQLTERLTEYKYQGSMEQIGKAIHRFSSNPLFDVIRFYEVVLFSFLTGNADMHLKNFSLHYPVGGMVQLTPAYDLLSTRLLIPEKDDPEETAFTINGKKSHLNKMDFGTLANTLGMNSKQTENTRNRFIRKIPEFIRFIEKAFLPTDLISRYQELIRERAERLELR